VRGSHTLVIIGLGSLALLVYAWTKRPTQAIQTPGGAATAGTAGRLPLSTRPAPANPSKNLDPVKTLTDTAKKEATAYGQQVIRDWFAGDGAP